MVVLFLFHPDIVPPGSIKCPHCGMFMNERYWNDGSSESKQPRILQGVDNIVVLVSIVYVCDNMHKMVAHDDIILKSFPSADMMPFLLLHRTGFTRVVFAQHCAGEELTFTICDRICENQAYGIIINFEIQEKRQLWLTRVITVLLHKKLH